MNDKLRLVSIYTELFMKISALFSVKYCVVKNNYVTLQRILETQYYLHLIH